MTEQYDPYEQDSQDADAADRVYMSGMDKARVAMAAVFMVVGLAISVPMLVDLYHWMGRHHFQMIESGPVMVYRVAAGIVVGVVTTFALFRYGKGVGITVGLLLMATAVMVRLTFF